MKILMTLTMIGILAAACAPTAKAQGADIAPTNSAPPLTANVMTASPAQIQPAPNQGNAANPTSSASEDKLVNLAKQDLAERLKVDISEITFIGATQITGADLYSGCTLRAGQVLMPNSSANGYQISLEAQGQVYLYHAGLNDQLVFCQNMAGTVYPMPGGTFHLTPPPPNGNP